MPRLTKIVLPLFVAGFLSSVQGKLILNDNGTFDMPGLSVLVFHNNYPVGHQGGIEIIYHDERIATNGDLRLEPTPGQWDLLPETGPVDIDKKTNTIHVPAGYQDLDISYTIHVKADGDRFHIIVDLDEALPFHWAGKVGFNLEIFPAAYFGKTWMLDEHIGMFPPQITSPVKSSNKKPVLQSIAGGRHLVLAPEDPLRFFEIESQNSDLRLYDGRFPDNNGWFVVQSLVPAGASAEAVHWVLTPHIEKDWRRPPAILHSQVGYHPDQRKQAIIECSKETKKFDKVQLYRTLKDGSTKLILSSQPQPWGHFLRYTYALFDFTSVVDNGLYKLRYEDIESRPFRIAHTLYQSGVWQPTLETFFPVQMCHMEIRDRFRIWHGLCHMDDALQAPPGHEHFDGYRQNDDTRLETKPYFHIDGLNQGGWHDAGDYDLATGSQASTVFTLALAQEMFAIAGDQTSVDQTSRLVKLHVPDGQSDIHQQIEHGVLYLLAGYRIFDHALIGIISSTLDQYVHLGDAMTMTDNQVFTAHDSVQMIPEHFRGKMDDRWAFTNRDSGLEYQVAAALAAAGRVLADYNPTLATECQQTARDIWTYEANHTPVRHRAAYVPRNLEHQKIIAAVELFKSTREQIYRDALLELLPEIRRQPEQVSWAIAQIFADLDSDTFDHEFFKSLRMYRNQLDEDMASNPFGLPYNPRIWGEAWNLLSFGVRYYFLHRAFPELFDRDPIYRVLHYVLGCHPGCSTSLVSGVGARSLRMAYGVNRADYSYIPGGVVSGTALIRPDFPELKTSWPYLWQQSEYVMGGAATFIFCACAVNHLLTY